MRKSLDHLIDGGTQILADFAASLDDGVNIDVGSWQIVGCQALIADQDIRGACAVVELSGGEPGCQYVLFFHGWASDGTVLHAEYWLNTRRTPCKPVSESYAADPKITVEVIRDG